MIEPGLLSAAMKNLVLNIHLVVVASDSDQISETIQKLCIFVIRCKFGFCDGFGVKWLISKEGHRLFGESSFKVDEVECSDESNNNVDNAERSDKALSQETSHFEADTESHKCLDDLV